MCQTGDRVVRGRRKHAVHEVHFVFRLDLLNSVFLSAFLSRSWERLLFMTKKKKKKNNNNVLIGTDGGTGGIPIRYSCTDLVMKIASRDGDKEARCDTEINSRYCYPGRYVEVVQFVVSGLVLWFCNKIAMNKLHELIKLLLCVLTTKSQSGNVHFSIGSQLRET